MSGKHPKTLHFIVPLVLSLVFVSVPAWADFQAGMDAYNRSDYTTALYEWHPLAEQGNVRAQAYLGWLYAIGNGVPQNYILAKHWFEKAAVQGDAYAQVGLGTYYATGKGGSVDYQHALRWFCLAANQEYALAQLKLGLIYLQGYGVPQDFVKTPMWFNLSAANGEKMAPKFRDDLSIRMTPAQIAEAQKLAQEHAPWAEGSPCSTLFGY